MECDINSFFKPIQDKELDLGLLGRLFKFSYECIYHQKEVDEEFNAFSIENPNVMDLLINFETELKKHQIIKNKTVQSMLGCSESQAAVFVDYFVKLEFVEKFDNEDSYFVLRDNIGSLRILLGVMLELCSRKFK